MSPITPNPASSSINYGNAALFLLPNDTALPYHLDMEIEFDAAKDAANIAERGIPFAFAAILLSAPHELEVDDRREYGEVRMIATGEIAGRVHVCVYTMRGDAFRIISLRRANRRESDAYRESHPG